MRLFSNPEIKKAALLFAALTTVCTGVCAIFGCAAEGFAVCAVFSAAFFAVERKRYKKLAELCDRLDGILHSGGRLDISEYGEGELSKLSGELSKLVFRLEEQADRLAGEKRELADALADISHQIKTPLTAANLVLPRIGGDPARLRELRALLDRTERLVSDLLKLSKLDAGTVGLRPERIPLSALAEFALGPVRLLMDLKNQRLELDIPPEASALCDPVWTGEALTNVIKNCSEHTPEGGVLRLTGAESALCSEISVSDTGGGIAPEDMPRIFERFYRGREAAPASCGIGLALARAVMASQSGTITAENIPGGAKFTLRLYKSVI